MIGVKKRRSKVKAICKPEFTELLCTEFKRLGIKLQVGGKTTLSRPLIWKIFSLMLDVSVATTIAGDRLSLSGFGTFWLKNGTIKFHAADRYRRALAGFTEEVPKLAGADLREKFQGFLSYLQVQDAKKTENRQTVDRLVALMGGNNDD